MGFVNITIIDIVDIFLVAFIIYYIYKLTKGTSVPGIFMGILSIYLLWVIVKALNMELLSAILGNITGVGFVAIIVVFQPEIRRFLQRFGTKTNYRWLKFFDKIFDNGDKSNSDLDILPPIVMACSDMSSTKTGALIVIQQELSLDTIVETGVVVDAAISPSLLKNLFFKNSPLHDGAVIIDHGRIKAAKCVLPSTEREVPLSFGMRHRAAVGMSEVSDAIIVVVSEETGTISIAHNGRVDHGISPENLKNAIARRMTVTEHRKNKEEDKH